MAPRPADILLAPLRLAAVATAARGFERNPVLGSERLNEWGLHARRVAVAAAMAARRRARLAAALSPGERAAFDRDGIVVRRNALPPELFAELRDRFARLRAPAREEVQGDALSRLIPLTPDTLRRIGGRVGPLLAEPPWQGLFDYAAGARTRPVSFIQTVFAQAVPGRPDPQLSLHADTFYPSAKSWLSLHDVAEEDGPFVYVPGSHRATMRRLAWERAHSLRWRDTEDADTRRGSPRVTAADLARLGLPPPVAFAVPANTLVVADTFGFHARGASRRPSVRVAVFTQGRRNPFLPWAGARPPAALDPLRGREAALFWALSDRLERWGLPGQPFRPVGEVSPDEKPGPRSPAWPLLNCPPAG